MIFGFFWYLVSEAEKPQMICSPNVKEMLKKFIGINTGLLRLNCLFSGENRL